MATSGVDREHAAHGDDRAQDEHREDERDQRASGATASRSLANPRRTRVA